jgi:membrane protein YdbS with pleckstrin-like domain
MIPVMIVRQSAKLIIVGYVVLGLLDVLVLIVWFATDLHPAIPFWVPLLLVFLLQLRLVVRHVARLANKLSVLGDRLQLETGIASKSTRTIELGKVQDVRVDQSFGQRLLNLGNLSVETAGGSSRLSMVSIDNPHAAATHILDLAKASRDHHL